MIAGLTAGRNRRPYKPVCAYNRSYHEEMILLSGMKYQRMRRTILTLLAAAAILIFSRLELSL